MSGPVDQDIFNHPGYCLDSLCDKRVIDVAIGPTHCLVITDDGDVYSWGKNSQGQLGDSSHASRTEPAIVTTLESKSIIGAVCGPAQVRLTVHRV